MTKIVDEVEPPDLVKAIIGECPRCSVPVEGFLIDAQSLDEIVITLRPCGCMSHRSDDRCSQFVDVLKWLGSLD